MQNKNVSPIKYDSRCSNRNDDAAINLMFNNLQSLSVEDALDIILISERPEGTLVSFTSG